MDGGWQRWVLFLDLDISSNSQKKVNDLTQGGTSVGKNEYSLEIWIFHAWNVPLTPDGQGHGKDQFNL